MNKDVMSHAVDWNITIWPMLTLVMFFGVAVIIAFWVFRRGAYQKYDQMGHFVLEDSDRAKEEQHG